MTRDERLQALLELRRRREPVTGRSLAAAVGCGLRTLCRDVARLREQGVAIAGEHGAGYVLKADAIPPLRFSVAEIEALIKGAGWVAEGIEPALAAAARGTGAASRLRCRASWMQMPTRKACPSARAAPSPREKPSRPASAPPSARAGSSPSSIATRARARCGA